MLTNKVEGETNSLSSIKNTPRLDLVKVQLEYEGIQKKQKAFHTISHLTNRTSNEQPSILESAED
jgi:hypothetical protein